MLDIGCGWGSLTIWAAQHYGVRAHGVTLSRAQADYAAERIRLAGPRRPLSGRVPRLARPAGLGALRQDRRRRRHRARGDPELPGFFGRVHACYNPGGLYLNHGIKHSFHWKPTSHTEFLTRYVFPNGELAGVSETLTEMERANFEILDVECLRQHYARTCRHWVERLTARADEARRIAGERVYRTWLLYLTCSAVAFETSSIGLYQVCCRSTATAPTATRPGPASTCIGDIGGPEEPQTRNATPQSSRTRWGAVVSSR